MSITSVKTTRIPGFNRRVVKYTSWFMKNELVIYHRTDGHSRRDTWYFENGLKFDSDSFQKEIDAWLSEHHMAGQIEEAITLALMGEST